MKVGFASLLATALFFNAFPASAQELCLPATPIIGIVDTVSTEENSLIITNVSNAIAEEAASYDAFVREYVDNGYTIPGVFSQESIVVPADLAGDVLLEKGDIVVVSASNVAECGNYDTVSAYTDLGFSKDVEQLSESATAVSSVISETPTSSWTQPKQLRPNHASDRFRGMVTSLFSIFR